MYIAIDETGSFREGRDLEYGIVTLVTITDKEWGKLKSLLDKLYPQGWTDIKGKNIDYLNRKKLLKFIGSKHEIKYSSILFDLTAGSDEWVDFHRKGQVNKVNIAIAKLQSSNGHPDLIKEMRLIASRLSKLANADYSKFIFIYDLYYEWLCFYQFDFVYIHITNDSWELNHIIDNQSKAGNFKTLLNQMLILTTNHLNPTFRTFSPQEFKGKKHPFELKHAIIFDDKSAIDGHKVFKNMKISNEQNDSVLLLPDLIGNTIHRSIKYRHEIKWLKMLKRLQSTRSIVMNNRFRKGKNNYYLIRGFDKSKNKFEMNPIIREHYNLMKNL